MKPMKNILVIAPQYVGDSILVIPFLRELRKNFKNAQIDIVTKNAGQLVLEKCPYINNVYVESKLEKNFYDKAYVLKRSLSAALLCKKLKIKETIGFDGQFRELFLKKLVKYKAWGKHELEHFFDVLKADNINVENADLEYWIDENSLKKVRKVFTNEKKALIVTSSSTHVKNWSIDKFNSIIEYLNGNNYDCFIVGLSSEKDYNQAFIGAKNLCGELSFDEISALISQMDLVFGIDSGFCHLASAFNKKTIALFGPTSKTQWGLRGKNSLSLSLDLDCAPCKRAKKCKKGFKCLKDISAEFAISKIEKFVT